MVQSCATAHQNRLRSNPGIIWLPWILGLLLAFLAPHLLLAQNSPPEERPGIQNLDDQRRFGPRSAPDRDQRKAPGRSGQFGTGSWRRPAEFQRPGFPPPFPPHPMENLGERPWAEDPDHDDGPSTIPLPLRMALPELGYVPSLRTKILRMAELLQERQRLEAERRRGAQNPSEPQHAGTNPNRVRQYHELLEAEDRIVAQMASTLDAIRVDAPQILEEIRKRRDFLIQRQEEIIQNLESASPPDPDSKDATAPKNTGVDPTASQPELRRLRRADRLLGLLQDRVTRIRESKSGPESARRMLRGGFQEFLGYGGWMGAGMRERQGGQPAGRMPESPEHPNRFQDPEEGPKSGDPAIRRRINQIDWEAQALRQRLKELDREREELNQIAPEPRSSPPPEGNPPTKP